MDRLSSSRIPASRARRMTATPAPSGSASLSESLNLSLPKTSSMQLMPHVDTREVPHRVGRVVVCQGWRFGQELPAARAVAGAGGRSRCPDAAGARCRTARTPAGRAEGGTGSRSACGPIARAGRSTHRSMIEFILGIWTPLSATPMPTSARMTSNRPGNFPSRSLIRNRVRQPASSRSITRFLAACVTQDAVGWAVAPRILILRLACSITASTCSRAPDKVTVSKKSQASRPSAWERRKPAHVVELRSDAGPIPAVARDLPDGGSGDLHPEYQQLAVHPAISPPGILADQPQHQDANRAHGARPARAPGPGPRACRRATTSRCQRSTVSGRTTRCSRLSTFLGSRCSSAATNALSPGVNRTLSGPSCRCRTESWWRGARISASLSRLLIGSSRSSANTFVTPR